MDIRINTGTKWTALAIATAVLVLSPFDGDGIRVDCTWLARLSYPLFHAGILHAICNAWCLITLVFYYDLHWWRLLTAYGIAISIPALLLSATPVVGLSGVCFALMGLCLPIVQRKLYFSAWVAAFLAVGIILPGVAWVVHLYCYVVGWVVGDFIKAVS